jgi:hypothetical protein
MPALHPKFTEWSGAVFKDVDKPQRRRSNLASLVESGALGAGAGGFKFNKTKPLTKVGPMPLGASVQSMPPQAQPSSVTANFNPNGSMLSTHDFRFTGLPTELAKMEPGLKGKTHFVQPNNSTKLVNLPAPLQTRRY